jgi:predicted nucleic acid-binding protein
VSAAERYLIDKSAYVRIMRSDEVYGIWQGVLAAGKVAVCEPVEAEILYSARSPEDARRTNALLRAAYGWVPVPEDVWPRLLRLQELLIERGCHRSAGLADLLVAVTAQVNGFTVLHYDHDFETIAKHTELQTCWVAPPGSIP